MLNDCISQFSHLEPSWFQENYTIYWNGLLLPQRKILLSENQFYWTLLAWSWLTSGENQFYWTLLVSKQRNNDFSHSSGKFCRMKKKSLSRMRDSTTFCFRPSIRLFGRNIIELPLFLSFYKVSSQFMFCMWEFKNLMQYCPCQSVCRACFFSRKQQSYHNE